MLYVWAHHFLCCFTLSGKHASSNEGNFTPDLIDFSETRSAIVDCSELNALAKAVCAHGKAGTKCTSFLEQKNAQVIV